MATKKPIEIPKVEDKWLKFKNFDSRTLRPVEFSWQLVSGTKTVRVYNDINAQSEDVLRINVGNYVTSNYFVLDKKEKRIYCYPVYLANANTRSACTDAHWTRVSFWRYDRIYMIDENKQIWEVPCEGYDTRIWNSELQRYDTTHIEPVPVKKSRFSTMNYKVSCQKTEFVRDMFGYLFGEDFVYQTHTITDKMIQEVHYYWTGWLSTKGRKLSDKTKNKNKEFMDQLGPRQKITGNNSETPNKWYRDTVFVRLNSNGDLKWLSYFSDNNETFRRVFNPKTKKLENYIWKNNSWTKTTSFSQWQNIGSMQINPTFEKDCPHDIKFINEAIVYFKKVSASRNYYGGCYNKQHNFIANYLKFPVIHQMLQIQEVQARHQMYECEGDLEQVYGKIPNSGKTIYKKLGVNKHQFNNPSCIIHVKTILGKNNISHIDDKTWDMCTSSLDKRFDSWYYGTILNYLKAKNKFTLELWCKIVKMIRSYNNGRDYTVRQLYADYYKSLSALNEFGIDTSSYPLSFNNITQLQRFHDDAARATSAIKNKAQDEKFAMLFEQRQKMLEDDGTYMITMPKMSSDLVDEGSKLHHCVGGYVYSVANGATAIYFLRQSKKPDEPWLTVEVRDKKCQQIHGSCNAWMGSKDEYFAAVPFLVYWFNKHNIVCDDNLLTNAATGYCQIETRRSMPIEAIQAYAKNRKKASQSKAS
jgi:hypothetical protein